MITNDPVPEEDNTQSSSTLEYGKDAVTDAIIELLERQR